MNILLKEKIEKNILQGWELVEDVLEQKRITKKLCLNDEFDLREKEIKELRKEIDMWEMVKKEENENEINKAVDESTKKLEEWKVRRIGFQKYIL